MFNVEVIMILLQLPVAAVAAPLEVGLTALAFPIREELKYNLGVPRRVN